MVMKQRAVVGLASDHFPAWQHSTNRAKMLDQWARGENGTPLMPTKASASPEYQELQEISGTPWSHLIISSVAQALSLVDHKTIGENAETTQTFVQSWKPNGLISRQGAIYRGALAQNLSYATTLPGKRPHTDAVMPIIKGVPATKMAAFYDDEGEDDFATFAMRGDYQVGKKADGSSDPYVMVRLYDEEATYFLQCNLDGSEMRYISHDIHDVGVTPVHRFAPRLDLAGRAWGEIEPFLPMLRRLDQDVFDRLIVQRFNSWRVRYVAGMTKPTTEQEKRAAAMALRVEDLLVSSDHNTKFGTLDPTDIKPYIEAHDADVRDLAAVSQTPPHHLLGQVANLSAEALAAAEKSLMRKVGDYRLSFGQTWDSVFRSCAFILDKKGVAGSFLEEATNYETEPVWEETEAMSLAAAADALGKIADGLGVPVQMLWEELPFWKKGDTERAKGLLQDQGAEAMLMQFLEQNAGSGLAPAERAA